MQDGGGCGAIDALTDQRTGGKDDASATLPALLPLLKFARTELFRMARFTVQSMASIEIDCHANTVGRIARDCP